MNERRSEADQVFQKTTFTDESTELGLNDRTVVASGAHTLTLPNVSEAFGLQFAISNETGSAATVTIRDNVESVGWSDINLTNDNQVVLFSDGRRWHQLVNTI